MQAGIAAGQRSANAQLRAVARAATSDAPCSPCQYDLEMLDSCDDPICMLRLPPERVAAEAERMLAAR